MADYNVNMKQWNGTSFDNVLPLAYNSKALGGKTYANVYDEITNYVASNYTKCEVISHFGNSTDASSGGVSFVFSFRPKFVIVASNPYSEIAYSSQSITIDAVCMIYMEGMSVFGNPSYLYTSFSISGTTLTMQVGGRGASSSGTHPASWECNQSGTTYYLCAFA